MSDNQSDNQKTPRYDLETYRNFVREAAPYISLILGQRIQPAQADLMTNEELTRIALLIDERVGELNKKPVN